MEYSHGKENYRKHPVINLEKTGENIKYFRMEKAMSVRELADYMDPLDVQSIYNWQEGKCLPMLENLKMLGKLFDKTIEEIVVFE